MPVVNLRLQMPAKKAQKKAQKKERLQHEAKPTKRSNKTPLLQPKKKHLTSRQRPVFQQTRTRLRGRTSTHCIRFSVRLLIREVRTVICALICLLSYMIHIYLCHILESYMAIILECHICSSYMTLICATCLPSYMTHVYACHI